MPTPTELRATSRLYLEASARECTAVLSQLLAVHALDLAMLAEKIERNGSGDNDPMGKPPLVGAPMSHIVEVRQIGGDLAEAMAAMRIWLDRYGTGTTSFEHSQSTTGITYWLGFVAENAAKAFAKAFHGHVKSGAYLGRTIVAYERRIDPTTAGWREANGARTPADVLVHNGSPVSPVRVHSSRSIGAPVV